MTDNLRATSAVSPGGTRVANACPSEAGKRLAPESGAPRRDTCTPTCQEVVGSGRNEGVNQAVKQRV